MVHFWKLQIWLIRLRKRMDCKMGSRIIVFLFCLIICINIIKIQKI
jgi:hypothetical protein